MNRSISRDVLSHPPAWLRALALTFAVAALGVPSNATATVYKWTDENGKVHYSDKPPAADAAEMDIESSPEPSAPTLTDTQRKAKQQRLLDAFEKERNEKKAAKAQAAKEKKQREAWCRRAREELAEYRAAAHLYDYDKDGNKVILSHEERAAAEQRYADDIKELC